MFGDVRRELEALSFETENTKRARAKLGRDKGSYRNLPAHSIHYSPNSHQYFPDSMLGINIDQPQPYKGA